MSPLFIDATEAAMATSGESRPGTTGSVYSVTGWGLATEWRSTGVKLSLHSTADKLGFPLCSYQAGKLSPGKQCGTGIGYLTMSSEQLRPAISRGRDPSIPHSSGVLTERDREYIQHHEQRGEEAFQAWLRAKQSKGPPKLSEQERKHEALREYCQKEQQVQAASQEQYFKWLFKKNAQQAAERGRVEDQAQALYLTRTQAKLREAQRFARAQSLEHGFNLRFSAPPEPLPPIVLPHYRASTVPNGVRRTSHARTTRSRTSQGRRLVATAPSSQSAQLASDMATTAEVSQAELVAPEKRDNANENAAEEVADSSGTSGQQDMPGATDSEGQLALEAEQPLATLSGSSDVTRPAGGDDALPASDPAATPFLTAPITDSGSATVIPTTAAGTQLPLSASQHSSPLITPRSSVRDQLEVPDAAPPQTDIPSSAPDEPTESPAEELSPEPVGSSADLLPLETTADVPSPADDNGAASSTAQQELSTETAEGEPEGVTDSVTPPSDNSDSPQGAQEDTPDGTQLSSAQASSVTAAPDTGTPAATDALVICTDATEGSASSTEAPQDVLGVGAEVSGEAHAEAPTEAGSSTMDTATADVTPEPGCLEPEAPADHDALSALANEASGTQAEAQMAEGGDAAMAAPSTEAKMGGSDSTPVTADVSGGNASGTDICGEETTAAGAEGLEPGSHQPDSTDVNAAAAVAKADVAEEEVVEVPGEQAAGDDAEVAFSALEGVVSALPAADEEVEGPAATDAAAAESDTAAASFAVDAVAGALPAAEEAPEIAAGQPELSDAGQAESTCYASTVSPGGPDAVQGPTSHDCEVAQPENTEPREPGSSGNLGELDTEAGQAAAVGTLVADSVSREDLAAAPLPSTPPEQAADIESPRSANVVAVDAVPQSDGDVVGGEQNTASEINGQAGTDLPAEEAQHVSVAPTELPAPVEEGLQAEHTLGVFASQESSASGVAGAGPAELAAAAATEPVNLPASAPATHPPVQPAVEFAGSGAANQTHEDTYDVVDNLSDITGMATADSRSDMVLPESTAVTPRELLSDDLLMEMVGIAPHLLHPVAPVGIPNLNAQAAMAVNSEDCNLGADEPGGAAERSSILTSSGRGAAVEQSLSGTQLLADAHPQPVTTDAADGITGSDEASTEQLVGEPTATGLVTSQGLDSTERDAGADGDHFLGTTGVHDSASQECEITLAAGLH